MPSAIRSWLNCRCVSSGLHLSYVLVAVARLVTFCDRCCLTKAKLATCHGLSSKEGIRACRCVRAHKPLSVIALHPNTIPPQGQLLKYIRQRNPHVSNLFARKLGSRLLDTIQVPHASRIPAPVPTLSLPGEVALLEYALSWADFIAICACCNVHGSLCLLKQQTSTVVERRQYAVPGCQAVHL